MRWTPGTGAIDAEQAGLVAHAHLAAPRTSSDPIVHAAYADLGRQVQRWFVAVAGRVRVVYTHSRESYTSARELSEDVRLHRTLEVFPSAREHDRCIRCSTRAFTTDCAPCTTS
jgi:hypothetical protein